MGAKSVFFYVNIKAIFCLALVATLTNLVLTQNLFTSMLDDTRNALMTFSSGSSSPGSTAATTAPTTRPAVTSTRRRTSGWGVDRRRRRRRSASPPSVHVNGAIRPLAAFKLHVMMTVKPTTPVKKRTSPSNKFLEALDQIERAVYEAQAAGNRYQHSSQRLSKIKANIKLAAEKRNYLFARQALGHGLYTVGQLAKRSGRKKRAATSTAVKVFMDSIKKELGDSTFDTFMSVNGDVTLMFAIDDTGSMRDEIQAAKDIATSIVNHPRDEAVDYILSPFNDPGTGPVTYKGYEEGTQFVAAIQALRAHAGGDCPELTFKGILDAMAESPNYGSPLYVFTDATAKDYTIDNMEEALTFAEANGITVNFFTTGLCSRSFYEPFERLARETCGQMFKLPKSSDLIKLTGITAGALAGATCLATGGSGNESGKKKWSVSSSSYKIPVDDSPEKLIISVTTEQMGPNIILKDPAGKVFTSGRIDLSNGAVYEINHPGPGNWELTVSRAGKHSYQVKGSSKTNIDFFVMIPDRGSTKPIPISHPLLGQKAMVIVTVAGAKKINNKDLNLDLMDQDGKFLGTATLTLHGTSGAHFSASFIPPSVSFKLRLRGKTQKGYNFERNSHNVVHPSHALIRVLYARNEFILPAGGSGFVMFVVHNAGPTEIFDIKVKDRLKYVSRLRRTSITVRQGRQSFFSVTFRAPSSAERGKGDEVLATITGRTSKKTVGQVVRLMVG